MKRICLWSGPRNVSTALMYSFAQRERTVVVDEPLYGHYLSLTELPHPGAGSVVENMENDGSVVVRDVIMGEYDADVLFVKSMAHHLYELDESFLDETINVVLTRDPVEMLPSLVNQIPDPILRDTGLPSQIRLLNHEKNKGRTPAILDARELLLDPRTILEKLCMILGLDFEESMLSWPIGPKPYDGVWAPHWYHNVHTSTGFAPYRPKSDPFPDRLKPLLEQAMPLYDELYDHALKSR